MSAFHQRLATALTVLSLILLILIVGIQDIIAGGATSQPEFSGSSGGGDMVDPFTGDFKYSIPLFYMGGYPINLGYNAGMGMEEDASWVGFGWNLNPGSVTRSMRGLPDDFDGDLVRKEFSLKPYRVKGYTSNVKVDVTVPIKGIDIGVSPTVNWTEAEDSYEGSIYGFGGGLGLSAGVAGVNAGFAWTANYNTAAGYNSSITPFLSASASGLSMGVSAGLLNRNSRTGQKTKGVNFSIGIAELVSGSISNYNIPGTALSTTVPMSLYDFSKTEYSKSVQVSVSAFGNGVGGGSQHFDNTTQLRTKDYYFSGQGNLYAASNYQRGRGFPKMADYNSVYMVETYDPQTQFLPQPQTTTDLFLVNNQEGGGVFKAERTDVGIFSVPYTSLESNQPIPEAGRDLDIKISFPIWGWGNVKKSYYNTSRKGPWKVAVGDKIFFKKTPASVEDIVSFKSLSDVTAQDPFFLSTIQNENLLIPDTGDFEVTAINESAPSTNWHSTQNIKRKEILSYLTAAEAQYTGRSKHIKFWASTPSGMEPRIESRVDTVRKPHHLSELQFVGNSGSRFVYGIPVYSFVQTNHSFSIKTNPSFINHATFPTLVNYMDVEDSKSNTSGKENLYMSNTLPAYATNYLLTEVLSDNYIDVNDNGCTDDDYGDFVKFEYQKRENAFKWRVPMGFSNNCAYLDKGLYSNEADDKASYSYGEKELWYIYSMESKDEIAFFHVSERLDGRPVTGTKGAINITTGAGDGQQKLDSIKIYSKYEWKSKGALAVPIKRVHFEYNYDLCITSPNSLDVHGGKLTLKALYFTYGKDYSGRDHKYTFDYKNSANYNESRMDRWGSYKGSPVDTFFPYNLPFNEFPYTYQHNVTNDAAGMWNLNNIGLPTGGNIEVEYESDAYAYVQDKKAMQMYKIAGFVSEIPSEDKKFYPTTINDNYNSSDLWDKEINAAGIAQNTNKSRKQSHIIIVEMPDNTYESYANAVEFFNRDRQVLFSIVAEMDNNRPERVNGFAKVASYGRILNEAISPMPSSIGLEPSKYMYIETVLQQDDNDEFSDAPSAMSYYTWQFALREYSKLVYNTENIDRWAEHSQGSNREIRMDHKGVYRIMEKKGIGRNILLRRSWVRLGAHQGFRYGGGHRVKSITMKDNWHTLTGTEQSHSYRQEYKYETEDGKCSGVASYEPSIGAEENPFKIIEHKFIEQFGHGPDKVKDVIGPICENYYPNPLVGYSNVKVISTPPSGNLIKGNGSVEYEFFTSKDFPFVVDKESKTSFKSKTSSKTDQTTFAIDLLSYPVAPPSSFTHNLFAGTQGYKIETNDFHGKMKRVLYKDENKFVLSSVNVAYSANNQFMALSKDGSIASHTFGKKTEVAIETYNETDISIKGYEAKTWKVFLIIPIPRTKETTVSDIKNISYFTNVKSVNRIAMPESVTFSENGVSYSVLNRLWDKETGNVIVKSVSTKFEDSLYQTSIPSYHTYDELGPSCENLRTSAMITIDEGSTTLGDNKFAQGDELLLTSHVEMWYKYTKAWVLNVNSSTATIVDQDGALIPDGEYKYLITRSGNRNRTSESMLELQSNKYPATTTGPHTIEVNGSKRILSASAIEYADDIKLPFAGYKTPIPEIQTLNTTKAEDAWDDFIADLNSLITIPNSPSVFSTLTSSARYLKYDGHRRFAWGLKGETSDLVHLPFSIAYLESIRYRNIKESMLTIKVMDGASLDFEHVTFSKIKGSGVNIDEFGIDNDEAMFLFAEDALGVKHLVRFDCPDINVLNQPEVCTDASLRNDCIILEDEQVVNPFVKGLLNNKLPQKAFVYRTDRHYAQNTSSDFDIRTDGYYNDFDSYWVPGTIKWQKGGSLNKWLNTNTSTIRHQSGAVLETVNAIDIPSSQLMGYADNQVVAQASPAAYNQIFYDGFEDYDVYSTVECATCEPQRKAAFPDPDKRVYNIDNLTSEVKHTGKYSLKFTTSYIDVPGEFLANFTAKYPVASSSVAGGTPYKVAASQGLPTFAPGPGRYIISAWVNKGTVTDYSYLRLKVRLTNSTTTEEFNMPALSSSLAEEIEGWRKVEFEFKITMEDPEEIEVLFSINKEFESHMYLDDFRFMPQYSTMKSFVYDKTYNRIMAELDENNYATFYEYDTEGNLIRTKKETVRGIYTTGEFRKNLNK